VEHPNQFPFGNVILLADQEFAAGDLRHANEDNCHEPNDRVVGLDEDDSARGHSRNV